MNVAVTPLSLDRACLPVAGCASCGRRALTYLDVSGEVEVYRCLACDAEVQATVTNLSRRGVEALGYAFVPSARKSTKTSSRSKCGANGVRGCGSGGCNSGSCGTGGGCGSGGCGAK
jgi:hypothetical protein